MDWYVLFVKTGKEEIVKSWLDLQFSSESMYCIVPKRKLREKREGKYHHVLRTIFPGYVFTRLDMDIHKYKSLLKIPGIIKVLNNGTYYSKVDESEISVILRLLGEGEVIDYSKIYTEGSKIFIKDGPLYGMEGVIKRVDKHKSRARVLLKLLGEERYIDVGIELLYKLN